ncbi:RHS repeat protein [Aspergillus udagawae]|uniref:RHS repeat protein n=1 Tax=Aspergillus udagawae TaxID=91492 RepID=A0A8H3SA41_9EURO|nr:RHS repeat protein [Aspergillus udagawae]
MSIAQSSIYSQGFNFGNFLQKGVDPRTGQYTCNIEIYEAPAQARNCPPFTLAVTFNPLTTQNVGLGRGWSFNLSSYDKSRQTLSLSTGENYQVIDRGDLFVMDQKLKSFIIKKTGEDYEVTYKSGHIEILSDIPDNPDDPDNHKRFDRAVPIAVYGPNGFSLQIEWDTVNGTPRLKKIQDRSQVLLEVNYKSFEVGITRSPNTTEESTFRLDLRNDQLTKIHTPLANIPPWEFSYDPIGGFTCISKVISPTGLVEEVHHKRDGHRLPTGAPFPTIPYATLHVARPGRNQPAIRTTYAYSSHNFLGYLGGENWNSGQDNLYLTPAKYEYSSTVKVEGGSTTIYTYNKFHLLVQTMEQKNTKRVTKSITYHALPDTDFKDQPPQYQLPKSISTKYEDTVGEKPSREEITSNEFDEWGNPTKEVQPDGVTIERAYYPASGQVDAETGDVLCPADPFGFQRYIARKTTIPAGNKDVTPTRSEHYTYCELPTATGGRSNTFVVVKQSKIFVEDQCLSGTDYTTVNKPDSRDHGRAEEQTSWVSEKHPTTQRWTYEYPSSGQLKQTITTETFDGFTVQDEMDYSLLSGLTVAQKDQDGVQDSFEYDQLGQLLKATTAVGTQYETSLQQEYAVPKDGGGTFLLVTDAKGAQTRYIADGLERLCEVEKQDSDYSSDGTFRKVQERSYNAQDQCIETVVIDWFRTDGAPVEQRYVQKLEYDDWGEVYKTTDSAGVVTISQTDPITRTQTEGIEGEGQTKTTLNEFGAPILTELLGKDGKQYSAFKYSYDGLGRLVEQEDALGRMMRFELDGFDRVNKTTWPSGREVTTSYASQSADALPVLVSQKDYKIGGQAFDGLNRVTSRTVGTRTVTQAYEGNAPEPYQITTAKGEQSDFKYEPLLGHAVTTTSTGGTIDTFEYDPKTGAPSALKGAYGSRGLKYFPSGFLKEETIEFSEGGQFAATSAYSMAGKLQTYTDVNGQKYETEYDSLGRLAHFTQGTLKASITYDKINRPSETRVQDTARNTSITTHLEYDDFNRETERTVSQGSKTLYKLTQTYGLTSLVNSRHLEDGDGQLLRDETFEYDDDNHLVKYTSDGIQSPADEHGRQLKSQDFTFDDYDNLVEVITKFQDGSQNTASYSYSSEDSTQLTEVNNTHPDDRQQISLKYDQNGCLSQDEQGRTLEYDSKSRLIAVRDTESRIISQYHYDAAGRLVCQSIPGQADYHLFYRGEKLVAVQTGDRKVSYLANGQTYWGQTVQEGGTVETQLWVSDNHASVLSWLDTHRADQVQHQQYTPYGVATTGSSIGYNGQWRDPVTGWYHLGNGYRVYNPVLMRFHTPDPWSPFISGEINPYAYCLGDPINRDDPSGHGFFSWIKKAFKKAVNWVEDNWKTVVTAAVGIAASVAVGVLTAGASLAIQVGVGLAVGAAAEFGMSVGTDLIEGNGVDWGKAGISAGIGALSGAVTSAGMFIMRGGLKTAAKGVGTGVKSAIGRAGKYAVTETVRNPAFKAVVKGVALDTVFSELVTNTLIMPNLPDPVSSGGGLLYSMVNAMAADASNTQSSLKSSQSSHGSGGYSSSMTRDSIRPALRDGESVLGSLPLQQPSATSSLGYGTNPGAGYAVAGALNLDLRCTFAVPSSSPINAGDSVLGALQDARQKYSSMRLQIRRT